MKKSSGKDAAPGRWRAAEEKLTKLLAVEDGTGTEGLTEEELAAVCGRRFDRADRETRRGLINLALRLRSPLTASCMIAKATGQSDLEQLGDLAELAGLAEDAPEWLAEAPEACSAMAAAAVALKEGGKDAVDREGEKVLALPEPLRTEAFRFLARSSGDAVILLARNVAGRGKEFTTMVADALAEVPSDQAAEFLLELLAGTDDKVFGKSLRRSLQRFRREGIRVEFPQEGAPVYKPAERSRPEAYMTGVDGRGKGLVFIIQPRVPQGLRLFETVVSDEKGLLEFNAYETHRRGVDKFVESLKTRPGLLLAPIAPAHARYLIGAALERNVKSGTRVPSGASEMRPYWDAGEESSAPLPEDALQTIESDETGSALATSAKLLENEAFKGWFVDPDLVSPFVERTREAESSKIVLNQLQRRERTAGLIREATDEIFAASEPDSLRDRYGQRLWRMAYLLSVRGDSVGAKQAKAVAERLRDRATQSSLTPFLYAIVEKTVQVLTRDEEEKEKKTRDEEGPSLIVKP